MGRKFLNILKKAFSFKVLIIILIIGLAYWNITSVYRFKILEKEKNTMEDYYLTTINLTKVASNMEGNHIDNIVLKNISGNIMFDSLFKHKGYIIAVYQNGMVCSPCIEYVTKKWAISKNQFNSNLSRGLRIINEFVDGKVLVYLTSVNLQNTYYIDSTNYIHDHIVKIDKPTNFIFLINKKRQIIFASYFTKGLEENFDKFLQKANRYLNNRS